MAEAITAGNAVQTTSTLGTSTSTSTNEPSAQWPLSFQLRQPPPLPVPPHGRPCPKQYWSHTLYRGPNDEPVQVFYSTTKQQSEELAQKFLREPVLGFDGEWWSWNPNPGTSLKSVFSLVQIASEDKIGLFHIALHDGETTEDLIAPSLRRIIESPDIIKTGVNIKGADFSRLRRYFELDPQGGFELSSLHNSVTGCARWGLVAMAKQVEYHLGLPLDKGSVRVSNWSKPLNARQKLYAAADAYAGFMLYHCMKAKSMAVDLPKPRSPTVQESEVSPLGSEAHLRKSKKTEKETKEKEPPSLDTFSQELFQLLRTSRLNWATAAGVPAYHVASDKVLKALAKARPTDNQGLRQIPGIGRHKVKEYGAEWISIISQFLSRNATESSTQDREPLSEKSPSNINSMGSPPLQSPSKPLHQSPSTTVKTARVSPPVLHTGISFHMADIAVHDNEPEDPGQAEDSDTSAFGSPISLSSSLEEQLKRKHCEVSSPTSRAGEQEPPSKVLKAAPSTAGCNEHSAKQTQSANDGIDYFSDQDEGALWAEAFENFDPQ